jgi:hypothetical protein
MGERRNVYEIVIGEPQGKILFMRPGVDTILKSISEK